MSLAAAEVLQFIHSHAQILIRAMDHRVFRFATRGQCIKGKKARLF